MTTEKGDDSLVDIPDIIPSSHVVEITDGTLRYLHLLCEKYQLTEEDLIFHGLHLAELDYAEFSARISAQYPKVWYED